MKVSDYIAARLARLGIDTCFSVTGGGAMHLNDAFGERPDIESVYLHHEQACAMAAEGYARITNRPALVCVTAGPGAINALNGVFGAYTDSMPMVIVSGQGRTDTLVDACPELGLRQLGDQEARSSQFIPTFVKSFTSLRSAGDVVAAVDKAYSLAVSGRPGPVWLEVPVNLQGQRLESLTGALEAPFELPSEGHPGIDPAAIQALVERLAAAERPLLLLGTGVLLSGTQAAVRELAERCRTPVVTAWSHDTFANDHPLFAGRPGTIGTRAGNLAVQACDLLVVLGSRLNIRQVSYNWESFASRAAVVMVDVDGAELRKPYLRLSQAIQADLADFVPALLQALPAAGLPPASAREGWIERCAQLRQRLDPKPGDYPREGRSGINPYHLIFGLDRYLPAGSRVVCGDATACIVPFQILSMVAGRRMFSNSGCASMGYDLPAALGAAEAAERDGLGGLTLALAGDGSLMMNLQELQTLANSNANIALLVLDNGGYLSIRQTQQNFFGREHGASPASGVTFPDFAAVSRAFGLPTLLLESLEQIDLELPAFLGDSQAPRVAVVRLDPLQEFEPRLKSRMLQGVIRTPELDDMYPHLSDELLAAARAYLMGQGPALEAIKG
jgi:acetolactate synthase-1/2/3 large subunit